MVDLSWLDSRIEFHNIKPLQSQNSLLESVSKKKDIELIVIILFIWALTSQEKETIWVPEVTFFNTANQVSISGPSLSAMMILWRTWRGGTTRRSSLWPGRATTKWARTARLRTSTSTPGLRTHWGSPGSTPPSGSAATTCSTIPSIPRPVH